MADCGFNIPNGFNLGIPNQHHNPNQQQQRQQPHIPPGVTSPQNGALWTELQQRYVNQVQHTQQLNQNAFAALNRAKLDTRIFQGLNTSPNGPQQQQHYQPGVPGLPGLGLASDGLGNGGGGGGPVEALQNQSQNSLLQFAAQRLNGLTPRQIANMNPQQREQLRQLRENQQQQQGFAQAQAQHQLQQQQQQQPPQLASQIPGLGQMGQSSTGFSDGQQPPWAQGPPQSNGIDGAVFLEQFVNLPIEAFRNHLINFKTKIKALEEQRDRLLQIKTPQMIEQAQRVQAQMNGLQNVMQQLTEAYTRRQPMNIQQAAAGGPSGQQAGQPAIQARL